MPYPISDAAGLFLDEIEDKGFVRPVKVQVGLSDGRMTELAAGDLAVGKPVVIGQTADSEKATAHGNGPGSGAAPGQPATE